MGDTLTDEEQVNGLIEDYLERTTEDDKRHRDEWYRHHVSSGGSCLRKRHYEDIGVIDPYGDFYHKEGVFERGRRVESFVLDALLHARADPDVDVVPENATIESGLGVSTDIDDFMIVGESDPFIETDEGILMLAEVKSGNDIDWDEIPYFSHKVQLNTYLNLADVPYGFFIYVYSGNFGDREVVKFDRDEALWEVTKTLHYAYHQYRKEGDLPPKTPVAAGECADCPYGSLCVRDDPGYDYTKENFPTD